MRKKRRSRKRKKREKKIKPIPIPTNLVFELHQLKVYALTFSIKYIIYNINNRLETESTYQMYLLIPDDTPTGRLTKRVQSKPYKNFVYRCERFLSSDELDTSNTIADDTKR